MCKLLLALHCTVVVSLSYTVSKILNVDSTNSVPLKCGLRSFNVIENDTI